MLRSLILDVFLFLPSPARLLRYLAIFDNIVWKVLKVSLWVGYNRAAGDKIEYVEYLTHGSALDYKPAAQLILRPMWIQLHEMRCDENCVIDTENEQ